MSLAACNAWCPQACCCPPDLILPQAEPEPGAPGTATIAVRLPDAAIVRRRFDAAADTGAVYAWLSCLEEFPVWERGTWALVTAFPRARLPAGGATLAQANVTEGGGALLIVEQL